MPGGTSVPVPGAFSSAAERVGLWRHYFRRENPRKLLGFFYDSEFPARRYRAARKLPDDRPLLPEDFIVEEYLADYDRLHAEMEECPGDFIFSASAFWGIPWLEAALGCPIRVNHTTGSLYVEKPPAFSGPASVPDFDDASPWIAKLLEFLDTLAVHSGGRYPLATTRMRGVADLLAALYGGEEFLFAMMERPGEVRETCGRLTRFYIEMGRFQLNHIPPFHNGIGSFYYHLWAPAGTVWHQEDSVMLLSPELYKEFILPRDREIFGAFQGNIMHFHSTGGYIPVDEVLSLGPTAVEMHIDSGGPSAEKLHDTHLRILEKSPLIIWGAMTEADLDWIFSMLPDRGVAVNAAVRGPDEARRLLAKYGGN